MKKLFMVLLLALVAIVSIGQELLVTTSGLVDKTNLDKKFVVINAEEKTAKELFNNAINYVNVNYKNPSSVFRGRVENEFLSFVTSYTFTIGKGLSANSFYLNYLTSITFKDGKVKYEIEEIEFKHTRNPNISLEFSGNGFAFYKKNGELKLEEAKNDLENYFNSRISVLKTYLSGNSGLAKKDDF